MIRTANIARRIPATLAMAGAVAFGAVALAPAASAATPAAAGASVDGSYTVVDKSNGNGPEAFLITDRGREPVFFCEKDKEKKRHNKCQADPEVDGRF